MLKPKTPMLSLPTAQAVATMLTNVTETMLGLSFKLSDGYAAKRAFRAAELPLSGAPPVMVYVSGDKESCVVLTARMFSCAPETVDASMIEDTLRELANIAAGHIKRHMSIDTALGLPKILVEFDSSPPVISDHQTVVLKCGAVELQVRITASR